MINWKRPHWLDENGERKPNDTSLKKRRCGMCGQYHYHTHKRCKDCDNAVRRERRKTQYKGKPDKLAYTHVIRNEDTKELFKTSLGIVSLPENHTVVFTAEIGKLLPSIYKDLSEYVDQTS